MDFSSYLPIYISIATALLLALCIGNKILGKGEWRRKKRLPPVAGTIFHQLVNFKRLHDFQTDLSRIYKTFRLLAPSNTQIYTADPANIEYILRTNFKNYGKVRRVGPVGQSRLRYHSLCLRLWTRLLPPRRIRRTTSLLLPGERLLPPACWDGCALSPAWDKGPA